MSSRATILQSGYIVDRRQDYIWFVGLPFAAICFALLSGHYLPGAALAAIALWITIPHHFVTWLRVYGSPSEFVRFKERFVLSPILLVAFNLCADSIRSLKPGAYRHLVGPPAQPDAAIWLFARLRFQSQNRCADNGQIRLGFQLDLFR